MNRKRAPRIERTASPEQGALRTHAHTHTRACARIHTYTHSYARTRARTHTHGRPTQPNPTNPGPASGINDVWSGIAAWVAATYPDKPFIISETGAGGIVGQHSTNGTRWSEEYVGLASLAALPLHALAPACRRTHAGQPVAPLP